MSREKPSINDVFRVGRVSAVFQERHTVTVEFKDRGDGLVTKELPVIAALTCKNKFYALPDEGEHVVCAFFGNGLAEGVVLGAIYDSANPPAIPDRDICSIKFEDGTILKYNREEHKLGIECEGDIEISAKGNITVRAKGNIHSYGAIVDHN